MQKLSLKLTAKTLALVLMPAVFLFFWTYRAEAAVGLSVGTSTLNLLQPENLFYGNVGSGSHASSSFLLFQNNFVDKLRIDINGNLTTPGSINAGAFTGPITGGSISAANVSAGQFGSNVGNGNFSFPGSVGIGVTNPLEILDLRDGSLYFSDSNMVGGGTSTAIKFGRPEGYASNWYSSIGFYASTGYDRLGLTFGTSFGTPYERMRITPEGNVGIGTTNPLGFLELYRAGANANLKLYAFSSSAYDSQVQFSANTNAAVEYSIGLDNSDNNFKIYSGENVRGTNEFIMNSLGNIGFGTSTPDSARLVIGTSTTNYTLDAGNYRVGNIAAPVLSQDAVNKSYLDSAILAATSSISTLWGGTTGGNIWNLNSGNVGVGTSSPSSKLQVTGTFRIDAATGDRYTQFSQSAGSGAPLNLSFGGTGTGSYLDITQVHPYYGFLIHGSSTWGGQGIQNDGTFGISHGSNLEDVAFYSQNFSGETMRIKGAGDVGIGTSTPNARLAINGGNIFINDGVITSGTPKAAITKEYLDASLTAYNSESNLWKINNLNVFASSTDWNIGIGTTDPTDKLTVVGSINSNSTINGIGLCIAGDCKTSWNEAGANSWSLDGNTVTQVKSFGTLDNFAVPFLTNGVERMRLMETGNLVLGATTTGVRLHVQSPQGAVAFFKSTLNGGNYSGYIGNGQTFSGEEFGLYFALNDMRLATYDITSSSLLYGGHLSNDASMVINTLTGNISMGTSTPAADTRLTITSAGNYSLDAGNFRIGNVATPVNNLDAVNKSYLDSAVTTAAAGAVPRFVGLTTGTYNGNNNGTVGYNAANAICAGEFTGSHVCASYELLNSINVFGTLPTSDAWVFSGPPAYTASANDCEGRTSVGGVSNFGSYWQAPNGTYPQGRGLLSLCSAVLKIACCE